MSTSFRLFALPFAAALVGCAPTTVTDEEIVPVYESPCDVFDAGDGACGAADQNGSYLEAWSSSVSCMDACRALNSSEPHALIACGPVHPAVSGDNAGFVVVECTFDAENYQ